MPVISKLYYAKPLWILDIIPENSRTALILCRFGKQLGKPVPLEDIVSENHRDIFVPDKVRTNNKGLREPIRRRLNGI